MSKVQIDNSFLYDKIKLRMNNFPEKDSINVLDCFAGNGTIWKYIKNHCNKKINILSIDKKQLSGIYLKGDNLKFLQSIDLNKFDVIDLDAYGVPYQQLKFIFKNYKNHHCSIFITFIQSLMGGLPLGLLEDIGYSKKMIRKIPTLFYKNGLEKMKLFLAQNGVREIKIRSFNNKYYIFFKL